MAERLKAAVLKTSLRQLQQAAGRGQLAAEGLELSVQEKNQILADS
jgi:hypothetical protein